MLGYRSFFTVQDEPRLHDLVDEQSYAWFREKSWNADALVPGPPVEIKQGVSGVMVVEQPRDGSTTRRTRVVEQVRDGVVTTELTVHVDRSGRHGWVWLDLDVPPSIPFANRPRLAPRLLDVLPAYDGRQRLGRGADVVIAEDVPDLVAGLVDPARRGLVFVAGTDETLPLERWRDLVDSLLRETAGLATGLVLDATATREFHRLSGDSHRVAPGTVRTFAPGVHLDRPEDQIRHRILSTDRIVRENGGYLRKLLGRRARGLATTAPLPAQVLRLDRRLRDLMDTALLERIEVKSDPEPVTTPARTPDSSPIEAALGAVLLSAFGTTVPSEDNILALGGLVQAARRAVSATVLLDREITSLKDQLDELEQRRSTVQEFLDDEQEGRALAEQDRAEAERQLRHARGELARTGAADAWAVPDTAARDRLPDSFDDLVARTDELRHVRFTGDASLAYGLDDHNVLGNWAATTWEILLALDDYAEETLAGRCPRDVGGYLKDAPAGCDGYPPGKHVPTESETVQNNPKMSRPRTLPVPVTVSSDGFVYMAAHFRIASYGMISPRMHYLDDTGSSGKVYVGYIGPHLENTLTS